MQAAPPYHDGMAQRLQSPSIKQIMLRKAPAEWPAREHPDALENVVIVGATVRDTQGSAVQALKGHVAVKEVQTVVLTKGSPHVLATVPLVLR